MVFISDNDYARAAENGVYPNLLRTRVYQLKWGFGESCYTNATETWYKYVPARQR